MCMCVVWCIWVRMSWKKCYIFEIDLLVRDKTKKPMWPFYGGHCFLGPERKNSRTYSPRSDCKYSVSRHSLRKRITVSETMELLASVGGSSSVTVPCHIDLGPPLLHNETVFALEMWEHGFVMWTKHISGVVKQTSDRAICFLKKRAGFCSKRPIGFPRKHFGSPVKTNWFSKKTFWFTNLKNY